MYDLPSSTAFPHFRELLCGYEEEKPMTSEASSKKPHVNAADYARLYAASVNDPDTFWAEHGKRRAKPIWLACWGRPPVSVESAYVIYDHHGC